MGFRKISESKDDVHRLIYLLDDPLDGVHDVIFLLLRNPLSQLIQDRSDVFFDLRLAQDVAKDADTLARNA